MFVNSFLFVTKDCFLVKRRKVRIRNGKETRKRKNNGMGDGQVKGRVRCGNNRSRERTEKIKTGHNNKKFMALSPPFRPNP